ncbi:MAG: MATE family efflux transporter [Odoribacter splanchnicus]
MQDGRLSKRVQMEGRNKTHSLVTGNITWGMLWFAVPMILGNLLQQFYNIADTLIVGRFLGAKALAAVGSAYTLMIFLTSVLLGLCMGSGVVFSLQYGARDHEALKRSIFVSLVLIGVITLLLNIAVFVWIDPILRLLQVPAEVYILMRDYLWIIFWGIGFTFLYNYYASLLRAVGNSVLPLVFLAVAVVLNIVLDLVFILYFGWGVRGAALATVIAQAVSGIGLCFYSLYRFPDFRVSRQNMQLKWATVKEIATYSSLTCAQQSVMNFGILMVQGLINSFGTAVMAGFAAELKSIRLLICLFRISEMPSLLLSLRISELENTNVSARNPVAVRVTLIFALLFLYSFVLARPLMLIFIPAHETEIISIGVEYLRIEGAFIVALVGCFYYMVSIVLSGDPECLSC